MYELNVEILKQDDPFTAEIGNAIMSVIELKTNEEIKPSIHVEFAEKQIPNPDERNIKDIDILLVGKTGNGKSATGNTILGSEEFECQDGCVSVTNIVQFGTIDFEGRKINVVDIPGFEDTKQIDDLESATKNIIEKSKAAVCNHPLGYHALLLVLRYGPRFTAEDLHAIKMLKYIFGPTIVREYVIILVTHGDHFKSSKKNKGKTFKQWCSEQTGCFQELLKECENRALLFDNETDDEMVRKKQVRKLITAVDKLQTSGRRYSDAHFEVAKKLRKAETVEMKINMFSASFTAEYNDLFSKFKSTRSYDTQTQILELKNLIGDTKTFKDKIEKEHQGSGKFESLLNISSSLQEMVSIRLNELMMKLEKNNLEKQKLEIETYYAKKFEEFKIELEKKSNEEAELKYSSEKKMKDQLIQELIKKIEKISYELKDAKAKYEQSESKMYKNFEQLRNEKDNEKLKRNFGKRRSRSRIDCKQQ